MSKVLKSIVLATCILVASITSASATTAVGIKALTNDSVAYMNGKYIYSGVPLDSINNKVYVFDGAEYTPIYGNPSQVQYKLGNKYVVLSDNTVIDMNEARVYSGGLGALQKEVIAQANTYLQGNIVDLYLMRQQSFEESVAKFRCNNDDYIMCSDSKPIKYNGEYKILCSDASYVYVLEDGKVVRLSKVVDKEFEPTSVKSIDMSVGYMFNAFGTVINNKLYVVDAVGSSVLIHETDFNNTKIVLDTKASDITKDVSGNVWYSKDKEIHKFDGSNDSIVDTCDEEILGLDVYDDNAICYWSEDKYYSNRASNYGAGVGTTYDKKSANWKVSNGSYTYTKENGQLAKDEWVYDNGNWYYFSGISMKTGWFKDSNGNWYMLGPTGKMQTGWFKHANGEWYYLDPVSGILQKGWIFSHNDWYYLRDDYSMAKGWFEVDGKVYHATSKGAIDKNMIVDGYKLDATGAVVK